MSKIVALKGPAPVQEVVDVLEVWLGDARSGRLRAVSLAGVIDQGKSLTQNMPGDANIHTLACAAQLAANKLFRDLQYASTDE